MRIRVLDLDGSLPDQPAIAERLAKGRASLLPLRSRGASLRLWAHRRSYETFEALWRGLPQQSSPLLTLVGSGDFHHLTASFIAAAKGPISVVHFDNHPDWCWTMPRRHCGSWVNEVLEMDHVYRVVTIGPSSSDLVRPDRKGANLQALSSGRLEVFPWRHEPSRVSTLLHSGAGHTFESGGIIRWHNLAETGWDAFLDDLVSRLPTERIWITVDKDVLPSHEAVTNWDQGALPLDYVIKAIGRLAARFKIVGADICGEYAPARYLNPLKYVEARLDQPRRPKNPALDVNSRTNERLISTFEEVL